MLFPRIIPCLLIKNKGLVKTTRFKNPKYVGDPINAVKIFNEKEVDELIVLDIDATVDGKEPDFKMIEKLAIECRMPLCYGGGIKTVDQARKIFGLGVEKIALSSIAVEQPNLVNDIAESVGSQSVAVVLDAKKKKFSNSFEIFMYNGKIKTGKCPVEFSKFMENQGAGEIVVNSIAHDGVMKGYDLELIDKIRESISIPMTVLGGAGSLDDIGHLIKRYGMIGAAAGSFFVFKGVYRAVLISYPTREIKNSLIMKNMEQYLNHTHR